ncbi:MAG: type II toxin-antitoxin system VapC family toxin [Dehalococcoidia bacterium]|nr:type II toxin-antitoxin system VapC family toxin [Dehalococcoidia bacterium]
MVQTHARMVYVETSVVSYLTARATSNLLAAAWQTATTEWWDIYRPRFELRTSALTIEEAGKGNQEAAARRLEALDGIDVLPITEAAIVLSEALLRRRALPTGAQNDAIHIAVSAVHGINYLLTWNFRHLANAATRPHIREVCEQQGYTSPEICTPSELIGGSDA